MSTLLPSSAKSDRGETALSPPAAGVRDATIPVWFRVSIPSREFEISRQSIKVLPTDQVVPVEVAYDPKARQV